jgi:uncharacterized protein YoxC
MFALEKLFEFTPTSDADFLHLEEAFDKVSELSKSVSQMNSQGREKERKKERKKEEKKQQTAYSSHHALSLSLFSECDDEGDGPTEENNWNGV